MSDVEDINLIANNLLFYSSFSSFSSSFPPFPLNFFPILLFFSFPYFRLFIFILIYLSIPIGLPHYLVLRM